MAESKSSSLPSTDSFEMPKTCQAVYLTGTSDINKLLVRERTLPPLTPKSLLVEIKACGFNFKEMMERMGMPGTASGNSKPPYVMGFEASGIIRVIGSEVKDPPYKVGTRVCVVGSELWSKFAIVEPKAVIPIPDSMSFEEAAAFPVVYLTAYLMLFQQANLQPGMSVLVHMVAGGVGTAAVQLCKTVPDVTIIGTCSPGKHERMKKMGVDYLIDYRTQDYAVEVRKIAPNGVDIVLDPLGGPDFKKGYDLLNHMGHIVSFGFANAVTGDQKSYFTMVKSWLQWKNVNSMNMMQENKTVSGFHLGYLARGRMDKVVKATEKLLHLYHEEKIQPLIDSVYSFSQIGDGVRRMHGRLNIGKIVFVPELTSATDGNDEGTPDVSKWQDPDTESPKSAL